MPSKHPDKLIGKIVENLLLFRPVPFSIRVGIVYVPGGVGGGAVIVTGTSTVLVTLPSV